MTATTPPVVMWFRQDLRLSDHPALLAAAQAGPVIPLFILDDETPGDWRWGGASRWWLHHSLATLAQRVPLVLRRGRADAVLAQMLQDTGAQALYFTRDYAPWSPALEQRVKALCESRGVACHRHGGFLLHEPEALRTGADDFYKVYTPFSKAAFARGVARSARPAAQAAWHVPAIASDRLEDWSLLPTRPNWAAGFDRHWVPGEAGAQQALARFLDGGFAGYAEGRNVPAQDNTSRLSPHLHWGEISPLQVWQAVSAATAAATGARDVDGQTFLKEVLWREFSYHLLFHHPGLPDTPFRPEFAAFPWSAHDSALRRWQRGETGYPIVDAGLRELWATGYMHNRVRMIVASFLVKHLRIPWQAGERWFWDTLVDADIGNNAASWQWVAGCGADAAPYFRIFNPVLQGERFDPQGAYVRHWLPALRDVPNDFLHRPWQMPVPPAGYPPPMVDHQVARDAAMAAYKSMKGTD